jgi:tetraacyldisaccharide 4'-kinase
MKAPQFWYQPPSIDSQLLTPFEYLYRMGSLLRHACARPYRAHIPVICVGNVVAGGAGKTPTALALAALLQKLGHKPAFVTRGYGGTQHGPLQVDPTHHNSEDVGDEALLLSRLAPVWIGRNRVKAIREAEKVATHIILDDGFQNPTIKPHVSLLVMDGGVGLGNGRVIPAGPLREPIAQALRRATAILIIGGTDNYAEWYELLRKSGKPLLRASLQPAIPKDFPHKAKFLAFAGIGRPEKFYGLCRKENLTLLETHDYADHHVFSRNELERLERKARSLNAKLLTTEKDFVRLPPWFRDRVLTFPVNLRFDDNAAVEKLVSIFS